MTSVQRRERSTSAEPPPPLSRIESSSINVRRSSFGRGRGGGAPVGNEMIPAVVAAAAGPLVPSNALAAVVAGTNGANNNCNNSNNKLTSPITAVNSNNNNVGSKKLIPAMCGPHYCIICHNSAKFWKYRSSECQWG